MDGVPTPLRCFGERHPAEMLVDDGVESVTSVEQKKVESSIEEVISVYKQMHSLPQPTLLREQHYQYLKKGLRHLSDAYECLDASRPWLCFWILHSLELLEEPIPTAVASDVCQFLARCQSPTGGFAGGPGQHAHLAPTYAAVNALCIIGTEEAYNIINREKLLDFLWSVKQPDGSFVMHIGGEVDVRSAYCAASVASLTNILTPKLFEDTTNWILSCQNWEGGLSGVPGLEAHGGYTFCGTAALVILGKEHMLDLKALLRWVLSDQMRFEGGFQGRCNKLRWMAASSFWQAGLLPLLSRALFKEGRVRAESQRWSVEQQALQEYILLCCQNPAGGLLDKPGKSRDFYHTCYCLSGLSIAQHFGNMDLHHEMILGKEENRLAPTHPVYNICPEKVSQALQHFHRLPVPYENKPPGASADGRVSDPAAASGSADHQS
ncbi:LOW QUALITY PROTEIN: protein farnesyltransferase subunit beta [Morone saxatilis]|uniref:LOW QUALITY PROTEIN: protein farnesyltransferase subunit beta n=1 Tax=Morone saxatilis TaxID=34816 RepID=UPI0015E24165|nr:LOW QUALITY PROTEIN: protein farnesyltransferase subunit beta [Morone saxatilis]